MTQVEPGTDATLVAEFRQVGGSPVDLDAEPTIEIAPVLGGAPVLAETSVGVLHPATGTYAYEWAVPPAIAAGEYLVSWDGLYGGQPVGTTEVVTVAFARTDLVTLDEVKAHLNIKTDNTAHDDELRDLIAAVPAVIERWIGSVGPVERTEVLAGSPMVVAHPPIIEVVSATPYGRDPLDVEADLLVDKAAGLIRYAAGIHPAWRVTVVYTSGHATVPPAVNLAARVIVEHWWKSQRAAGTGNVRSGDEFPDTTSVPGMGFALPRYAIELLEPFRTSTGLS